MRNEQTGLSDYTAVVLFSAAVRTQARQLAPKYADVIIDVGGRDTGSFRAALTITDRLLIPVQPRTFDVWAMEQVCALIEEARTINEYLQAFCVLNAADPVGRDNNEAAEALQAYENVRYLDCPIVRRKGFPNASAQGKSVLEYTPRDQKAVDEITNLIAFVYQSEIGGVADGYRKEA